MPVTPGPFVRSRVRTWRDRWIDQPLRQLELARRLIQDARPDVLVFGESSCLSRAAHDIDLAMIPELIGRQLGAGRVVTIALPGIGAVVPGEMLRILSTMRQRPGAVVVAVNIRSTTAAHVVNNPEFGRPRSVSALQRIASADRRIRAFGRGGFRSTAQDLATFLASPVHSRWSGDTTVGAYRQRLLGQGPPPWPPEIEKLRFDYFHGEVLGADNPMLDHLATLGRRISDYGVPAVGYFNPPPMLRGEHHFPGEFSSHVRSNFEVMKTALFRDVVQPWPIVEVPFADEDSQDSRNAAEHYSYSGRLKIATAVARQLGMSGVGDRTPAGGPGSGGSPARPLR